MTTARLVLAPLRVADASAMVPVLADPDLYRFTGGTPPGPEELERRYRAQIAGPATPDETWHNWILRRRADEQAVGYVQATVTGTRADIAWLVGVAWQRQGYATEATRAMCDWLLTAGVEHLTAHIHPDHDASAQVAAAVGLERTAEVDEDGEQLWTNRPDGARPAS